MICPIGSIWIQVLGAVPAFQWLSTAQARIIQYNDPDTYYVNIHLYSIWRSRSFKLLNLLPSTLFILNGSRGRIKLVGITQCLNRESSALITAAQSFCMSVLTQVLCHLNLFQTFVFKAAQKLS